MTSSSEIHIQATATDPADRSAAAVQHGCPQQPDPSDLADLADVIDVREIPHGQRHPRIFARWARLAPGDGFTLVNNHDPKPLRREFEATHPGAFTWDYVESGPELWRVRIGRAAVDV
ncbi:MULTISPECIES: DUF2249 domain-containing protein [unclassified Streptomyces]|uniref:DUF2249 domain-containing protein n=1 Tax=unclassified Streptomyces TaxID=2593676 RepID=UPI002E2A2F0F|nr:DUF2249 domain-containing protein [Streptomyces sp. NBC_00223]